MSIQIMHTMDFYLNGDGVSSVLKLEWAALNTDIFGCPFGNKRSPDKVTIEIDDGNSALPEVINSMYDGKDIVINLSKPIPTDMRTALHLRTYYNV